METEERFTQINYLHEAGVQLDAIIGRVANEPQPPLPVKPNHAYVCIDPISLKDGSAFINPLKENFPCYPLKMDFASKDLLRLVDGVFDNIIFDRGVANKIRKENFFGAIFEWYRLLDFGGRLWIRGRAKMIDLESYRAMLYSQGRYLSYPKEEEIYQQLDEKTFKDTLAEVGIAAGFTKFFDGIMDDGNYPVKNGADNDEWLSTFPYYMLEK